MSHVLVFILISQELNLNFETLLRLFHFFCQISGESAWFRARGAGYMALRVRGL